MAFQLALDALAPTTHRDPSLHPILESTVDSIRSSITTYPWSVPKQLLPLLNSYGIPTSGLGTSHHPHAAHKTIETFLLHVHWSFQATTPSSVMFMKPSKFHKLARVNSNFRELKNYRLHPTDSVRYPVTSPDLPTFPTIFMHDALMYYHPSQILDLFTQCPNLEKLYASLVVPPEATLSDHSLYPSLYTYTTSQQTLHYVPEGHEAGSYNQPMDALSWLKVNQISHAGLHLSVTILESWGPVHSLLIQRGLPHQDPALLAPSTTTPSDPFLSYLHPREDLVSFRIPDAVLLPEATFLNQPLRHRLVPRAVYNSLFTYTRAVRTLRTSDPAAFVRMHSSKPEHDWVTPTAWDNLQTFALLNVPLRPNVVYQVLQSPLAAARLYLGQHWRRLAAIAAPTLSFLTLLQHFLPLSLPLVKVKSISLFRRRYRFDQPPRRLRWSPINRITDQFPPADSIVPASRTTHWAHSLELKVLQLLRPIAPLLSLTPFYKVKQVPFLPHAQLSWTRKNFALPWQASLLLLAASELSILFHKLTSSPTLQAQHDIYHRHMHPGSFKLMWERKALQVSRLTPFLPFTPLNSTPHQEYFQTAHHFSPSNPTGPARTAPTPLQPLAPMTTEASQTRTEATPTHVTTQASTFSILPESTLPDPIPETQASTTVPLTPPSSTQLLFPETQNHCAKLGPLPADSKDRNDSITPP